jgi:hypothetical protein
LEMSYLLITWPESKTKLSSWFILKRFKEVREKP